MCQFEGSTETLRRPRNDEIVDLNDEPAVGENGNLRGGEQVGLRAVAIDHEKGSRHKILSKRRVIGRVRTGLDPHTVQFGDGAEPLDAARVGVVGNDPRRRQTPRKPHGVIPLCAPDVHDDGRRGSNGILDRRVKFALIAPDHLRAVPVNARQPPIGELQSGERAGLHGIAESIAHAPVHPLQRVKTFVIEAGLEFVDPFAQRLRDLRFGAGSEREKTGGHGNAQRSSVAATDRAGTNGSSRARGGATDRTTGRVASVVAVLCAADRSPMDLSRSHILVTGGAGFIGSHCVDALVAAGARVTVVDDLSAGRADRVPGGVELMELDIRDAAAVSAAFARARPDGVLHLAAQVSVPRSVTDPATDAAINVLGTANVLTAAIAAGARAFVNTSSGGAVYGDGPVPADESAPIAPLSPYGASKAAAERYVDWAADTQGIAACSLRLSNVYGPRQDDQGEAGVVAIFVNRVLAGQPLELHGDGEQTRDFVHVADVVRAQLAALTAEARGPLNIGTGATTSIRQLAQAVIDAGGDAADPELRFGPARAGDVRHSLLTCDRAAEAIGFRAEIGLGDGVLDTVDYWRSLEQRTA